MVSHKLEMCGVEEGHHNGGSRWPTFVQRLRKRQRLPLLTPVKLEHALLAHSDALGGQVRHRLSVTSPHHHQGFVRLVDAPTKEFPLLGVQHN
jgi:hypothetical protein